MPPTNEAKQNRGIDAYSEDKYLQKRNLCQIKRDLTHHSLLRCLLYFNDLRIFIDLTSQNTTIKASIGLWYIFDRKFYERKKAKYTDRENLYS
jgi:hypothetical protein